MAYLSLDPVADAVLVLLNVAGLTNLVSTRIYDDVPQAPTFPFVFYEVQESRDLRGFGTGGLPEVQLRVHAFSSRDDYNGMQQAHEIIQKVIELLRDQALTVTGYTHQGRIVYDETTLLPNEIIAGVKCRELVASFRIWVEEAA